MFLVIEIDEENRALSRHSDLNMFFLNGSMSNSEFSSLF